MSLSAAELQLLAVWARDYLLNTTDPYGTLRDAGFEDAFVGGLPYARDASTASKALILAVGRSIDLQMTLIDALLATDRLSLRESEGRKLAELQSKAQEQLRVRDSNDHFRTCLVGGFKAFIDRQCLRDTLRRFVDSPELLVLIVDGDKHSGQSYTYELIRHLSQFKGFKAEIVHLTTATTAERAVQRLARRLGVEPEDRRSTIPGPTPSMDDAVDVVVQHARDRVDHPWVILDDCDEIDQNSDVWDFIGCLANAMFELADPGAEGPRLVLLGYPETSFPMPHALRSSVARDTAKVADQSDVEAFFAQYFEAVPPHFKDGDEVTGEEIPDLVDQSVDYVMNEVQRTAESGESYMRRLCTAVEVIIRAYQ